MITLMLKFGVYLSSHVLNMRDPLKIYEERDRHNVTLDIAMSHERIQILLKIFETPKTRKNTIPPTMSNVPAIQKLAYIHKIRMAKSPTIKIPGV